LFDPNDVDDLVKKIQIATTKKYPKLQNTMFNFMKTVDGYEKIFGEE